VAVAGDCPEVRRYKVGQLCRWLLPGDLLTSRQPGALRLEPSFFRFRAPDLAYDDWARDDPCLARTGGVVALAALRPSMWRYARTRATRLPP